MLRRDCLPWAVRTSKSCSLEDVIESSSPSSDEAGFLLMFLVGSLGRGRGSWGYSLIWLWRCVGIGKMGYWEGMKHQPFDKGRGWSDVMWSPGETLSSKPSPCNNFQASLRRINLKFTRINSLKWTGITDPARTFPLATRLKTMACSACVVREWIQIEGITLVLQRWDIQNCYDFVELQCWFFIIIFFRIVNFWTLDFLNRLLFYPYGFWIKRLYESTLDRGNKNK